MTRFFLSLTILVILLSSSCKCPGQKASVTEIKATHELVAQMLTDYVDHDPKLDEKEKARRHTLLDTDRDNILKLEASLGK